MKYKEVAKNIVLGYFYKITKENDISVELLNELYEINHNDAVLLEHCKTIIEVLEEAIKEIEGAK